MPADTAFAATTTLPPLAAAMTAADLAAHAEALRRRLGDAAEVYLGLNRSSISIDAARMQVYPDGILKSATGEHFAAPDWPGLFAAAETWIATQRTVLREATIRRMALDIIDLTDQHGRCTVAMLRGRGHSEATIADLRDTACARAGEMGGNTPFTVEG